MKVLYEFLHTIGNILKLIFLPVAMLKQLMQWWKDPSLKKSGTMIVADPSGLDSEDITQLKIWLKKTREEKQ